MQVNPGEPDFAIRDHPVEFVDGRKTSFGKPGFIKVPAQNPVIGGTGCMAPKQIEQFREAGSPIETATKECETGLQKMNMRIGESRKYYRAPEIDTGNSLIAGQGIETELDPGDPTSGNHHRIEGLPGVIRQIPA